MASSGEDEEVPDEMPYDYDDIEECKDIEIEDVKKDYKSLIKFKALDNAKKQCGNKIVYQYQFHEILITGRSSKTYKILKEWFNDEELKQKLWKTTIKKNRSDKYPSPTDVYECHRLISSAIMPFKSTTAKYILKKFNSKNVLDCCAGWGSRMLGASSLGIKYTGIDTNTNLKKGYNKMIKDLQLENVKMIYDDCLNIDFKEINPDLILTTPPHCNQELYSHMELWEDKIDYMENFMIPLMKKCFETNAIICMNIPISTYNLITKIDGIGKCDEEIELRQQLTKPFKTKANEFIYVWMNGNGDKKINKLVEDAVSKQMEKVKNKKEKYDYEGEYKVLNNEWEILNKFFATKDFNGQEIVNYVDGLFEIEDERDILEVENKKLKEKVEELEKFSTGNDKIKELKKENRKLEIQNDEYETGFFELYGILDKHDIIEDTTPKLMEMIDIVDKKLMNEDCGCTIDMFGTYDLMKGEIEELKKENKILKDENDLLKKDVELKNKKKKGAIIGAKMKKKK